MLNFSYQSQDGCGLLFLISIGNAAANHNNTSGEKQLQNMLYSRNAAVKKGVKKQSRTGHLIVERENVCSRERSGQISDISVVLCFIVFCRTFPLSADFDRDSAEQAALHGGDVPFHLVLAETPTLNYDSGDGISQKSCVCAHTGGSVRTCVCVCVCVHICLPRSTCTYIINSIYLYAYTSM